MVSIIGEDLAALSRAASMALWRNTSTASDPDPWETHQNSGAETHLFLFCRSEAQIVQDLGLQSTEGLQQGWDQPGGVRLEPGTSGFANLHQGLDTMKKEQTFVPVDRALDQDPPGLKVTQQITNTQ